MLVSGKPCVTGGCTGTVTAPMGSAVAPPAMPWPGDRAQAPPVPISSPFCLVWGLGRRGPPGQELHRWEGRLGPRLLRLRGRVVLLWEFRGVWHLPQGHTAGLLGQPHLCIHLFPPGSPGRALPPLAQWPWQVPALCLSESVSSEPPFHEGKALRTLGHPCDGPLPRHQGPAPAASI